MMRDIKESDWKILRQVREEALERFCKHILLDIERVSSDSARGFHQRYLDIWKVLRERDKELGQAFDNPRRSTALMQLASMKILGLVTEDEFLRFSQRPGKLSVICLKPEIPGSNTNFSTIILYNRGLLG